MIALLGSYGETKSDALSLAGSGATCVEDMVFIAVDNTDKLDVLSVDGVLGLSPGHSRVTGANGKQVTNSFIESLYRDGLIDERVFSLYISDQANYRDTSMFTAGGYDLDKYAFN